MLRPRIVLTGLAFLLWASTTATSIVAAPPLKSIDETTFLRLTRLGPFTAELQGKINFRVPTGYRVVLEDKLPEFAELTNFPIIGDEGCYIAMDEKPTWSGVVLLLNDDPLKGIDPATLTEPSVRSHLLEWQHKFHESRRPRKGVTRVPSKVSAWTHAPKYDPKTKILTMGVRLEAESEGQQDKVNYQLFVYGPDNTFVCVSAFCDVLNYERAEKEVGKLADEFTFIAPTSPDSLAQDDPMYLVKVIGGGILGAIGVMMLFKLIGNGMRSGTRPTARRTVRR